MNQYLIQANEMMPELVENRRHFHRYPEVRDELYETAKYVRTKLEEMGYEVEEICQCGLVAIAGGKKQKMIMRMIRSAGNVRCQKIFRRTVYHEFIFKISLSDSEQWRLPDDIDCALIQGDPSILHDFFFQWIF